MSTFARYFHTVRHLRPAQVVGRVRLLLSRPRPDVRPAPPARELHAPYTAPVAPQPSLLGAARFRFLNLERDCPGVADWQARDVSRLWVYNLHYFDDLNAVGGATRHAWHTALLRRWVAENPPGQGAGWEPYPLSRRIINWVKWSARGNVLPPQCHASLAVQSRWLTQRLEYHILGNHLFANAKALVHAGLYCQGEEAESWYALGMRIVARELREQVLPDGGHFELSTMYHAAALEDLLDLINVLRAFGREVPSEWLTTAARMQRWLVVMSHPDGEIAFFNDAAFGVAPTGAELEAYAVRLGLPTALPVAESLLTLNDSGYVRAAAGAAYLICDCAQVGPDYLPGHAHADTLSFELSLGGQRLLVNSGTSEYGTGVERLRQRGTAAHNTVVIDGQDSSEVWSGFRVARRARARLQRVASGTALVIAAGHDGYRRLRGGNLHERQWILDARSLRIEDRISGAFGAAAAWFHLAPHVEARQTGAAEILLRWADNGCARLVFDGASALSVSESTWHPRFGVSLANRAVVALFSAATLSTSLCWDNVQ